MSIIFENEKVLGEIKRHPFYFYMKIGGLIFSCFLPPAAYIILINSFFSGPQSLLFFLFLFFYSLFLMLVWVYGFVKWTDYFVDTWIVTNTRVIDFELNGLFNKDEASVRLENIQDVKVIISGVVEHWLNIGDMHLQTAGADKEFLITGVRDPDKMKALIFEAINNSRTV